MKSTTLRRSNITREKVAMMEALTRYNNQHQNEDFYRAQNKTKELDVLWQSFGVKPNKSEKAPQVYFVTGLICISGRTPSAANTQSLPVWKNALSTFCQRGILPMVAGLSHSKSRMTAVPTSRIPAVSINTSNKTKIIETIGSLLSRFHYTKGAFYRQ